MFQHRNEDDRDYFEKAVQRNVLKEIRSGKLDLYEYALYLEEQFSLYELKQVVEKKIREEMYEDLCEYAQNRI